MYVTRRQYSWQQSLMQGDKPLGQLELYVFAEAVPSLQATDAEVLKRFVLESGFVKIMLVHKIVVGVAA